MTEYNRTYFGNYFSVTGLVRDDLEFSSTFQWANIKARSKEVYRVVQSQLSNIQKNTSFDDTQFNLQLKLRYKMGPFSDIFLVYARGGEVSQDTHLTRNRFHTLERAWRSPKQESLTLKLRYLF